jgi:hypothetical protein
VLAKQEFEAWFLASAPSLAGTRGLPNTLTAPADPEGIGDAKGWLGRQMAGGTYSETLDQPAFAAGFDLAIAEQNSDSFQKFMRDIRSVVPPADTEDR